MKIQLKNKHVPMLQPELFPDYNAQYLCRVWANYFKKKSRESLFCKFEIMRGQYKGREIYLELSLKNKANLYLLNSFLYVLEIEDGFDPEEIDGRLTLVNVKRTDQTIYQSITGFEKVTDEESRGKVS